MSSNPLYFVLHLYLHFLYFCFFGILFPMLYFRIFSISWLYQCMYVCYMCIKDQSINQSFCYLINWAGFDHCGALRLYLRARNYQPKTRRGNVSGRVCNALTLESLDLDSSRLYGGTSSERSGHVRISRSSGQGQGHSSKKPVCVFYSRMICIRLKGNLVIVNSI